MRVRDAGLSRVALGTASDELLARATTAGSEAAFSVLFARYQPRLLRYCKSLLLDSEDAVDATQCALSVAARVLQGSEIKPRALRPWLYRIAHNEAMRILRKRSATCDGVGVEELSLVAATDEQEVRERLRELMADLHQLPERQRGALMMRELSGLAYDEIAEALEISEGAARQTVFAARTGLCAARDGRALGCDSIRRTLSDGDRRAVRGRRLRAHLRSCQSCADFEASVTARRRDLHGLFPAGSLLAVAAAGGAGAGAAGSTAAVTAGGWLPGLLGSVSIKCAAVCATAAVVGVGGVAIERGTTRALTPASGHAVAGLEKSDRADASSQDRSTPTPTTAFPSSASQRAVKPANRAGPKTAGVGRASPQRTRARLGGTRTSRRGVTSPNDPSRTTSHPSVASQPAATGSGGGSASASAGAPVYTDSPGSSPASAPPSSTRESANDTVTAIVTQATTAAQAQVQTAIYSAQSIAQSALASAQAQLQAALGTLATKPGGAG